MTHNLHIFDIINYSSTFCPIRHFVPFDVLSHSTFWHSTFCLIRCYFYSTICPIWRFVPFDLFYVRYFVHSTFCPIRYFVCSTFCLIRHFGIRHFVPFDVLSFDVLSIRRLLLGHFVGEPIEPVYLLLSSHYSSHLLPPAHSHGRRWHTKCKYEICKAYYLPNKSVIKSLFIISNLDLVESNMLYIDIFITEIYIIISESFINLIRLLLITLKMATTCYVFEIDNPWKHI